VTVVFAAVIGLAVGSIPTAGLIARVRGIDLMAGGSRNPGANNAWRLGGAGLGATVLTVEAAKGIGAVLAGLALAGPWGAAAAGVTAVIGNILNPWLGFRGGQGLGISAGVLLSVWPIGFVAVLCLVGAVAAATRSSRAGALSGAAALAIGAGAPVPAGWGLTDRPLVVAVIGVALAITPKQLARVVRGRTAAPVRRQPRGRSSPDRR
jgi:glycerol-3-phosphate acyltransferase PlsY